MNTVYSKEHSLFHAGVPEEFCPLLPQPLKVTLYKSAEDHENSMDNNKNLHPLLRQYPEFSSHTDVMLTRYKDTSMAGGGQSYGLSLSDEPMVFLSSEPAYVEHLFQSMPDNSCRTYTMSSDGQLTDMQTYSLSASPLRLHNTLQYEMRKAAANDWFLSARLCVQYSIIVPVLGILSIGSAPLLVGVVGLLFLIAAGCNCMGQAEYQAKESEMQQQYADDRKLTPLPTSAETVQTEENLGLCKKAYTALNALNKNKTNRTVTVVDNNVSESSNAFFCFC